MDDLISRQAAIDALKNDMASLDHIIKGMSAYDVRLDAYVSQRNQVNCDIDTINNLPTAQPEQLGTNLAGVGTDMISRQAAIDALDEQIAQCNKALKSLELSMKDEYAAKVEKASLTAFRERLEYLPPAQPEPCEDAVKSHSEKDVLNMCISLLDEMVGYFSEYMEWIGYEPTEEEKECGYFGMTYFHIVQKLFLYHTTHSGGTSTFKKCHELGIDDPSDGVRFPLWKEEEGDAE